MDVESNEASKTTQKTNITGSMANEKVLLRQAIDEFAEAFQSKNLERILALYAPDILAYDLMPPLQHKGIDAWRKLWQSSLPMMDGDIKSEVRDLTIEVNQDLAFCYGLSHFSLTGGKQNVDTWMRWTAGFKKINDKWLVTHEHTSYPTDMQSGKALMNLKPEDTVTH